MIPKINKNLFLEKGKNEHESNSNRPPMKHLRLIN